MENTVSTQPVQSGENPSQTEQAMDDGASKRKKKNMGLCSQELLKLVARGSAIIAEILRLKDYIPEPYINPQEEKFYSDIMIDFSFFQNEKFERRLKSMEEIRKKDEDFRENHIERIERFFLLFDSIYQYITDWKEFISQVQQGRFVQHTIETIISSKDLRHIFFESIFSAGVMLLLIDRLIPGVVREKLIISYYRYKGKDTIKHFNELTQLFKRTEYHAPKCWNNAKDEVRPSKYPIEYFKRAGFNEEIVKLIVGSLKDVDIYDQTMAFPNPEQRSFALSGQASIISVTLFFVPSYLESESKKMREIVDKYFNDNWVIAFYMGYTLDISEYWSEFKAAKKAWDIELNNDSIKEIKEKFNNTQLEKMIKKVKNYLNEGIMIDEYVWTNIEELLNIMRESNVMIRWLWLQRQITDYKYRDIVNSNISESKIIELLLYVSQFEYWLKNVFDNLIAQKQEMWNNDQQNCTDRLNELIAFYKGDSSFNKQAFEKLAKFFEKILKSISKLNYNNATVIGKKISEIKDTISYQTGLYQIKESVSAQQNIQIIFANLDHMLRVINIKKQYSVYISKISDFSYAWISIQDYSTHLQNSLKEDSKNVLLLRAVFLKLASILNFPLVRWFQIESEDIESVTNYYSGEWVKFVKQIWQIIPKNVFNQLDLVIATLGKGFEEIPIKLPKVDLKNYIQASSRHTLAKATHQISWYTKGIFMMEKTLMGVIEVDPKTILEEGIRMELLNLLARTYHEFIDFALNSNINWITKMEELYKVISNIKRSFIYVQDYININGSKMWCEEMHRLINYYVEIEANSFLTKKIRNNDIFESEKYTIPKYPRLKNSPESVTFLGRLAQYIIHLTAPKNSNFYPANYSWYDYYNKELFGIKALNMIKQAIGIEGFQGLNKLISYINYHKISNILPLYEKLLTITNNNNAIKQIAKWFGSPFVIEFTEKETSKALFNSWSNFSDSITSTFWSKWVKIGQIEFLRKLQNYSWSENAEVDSYIWTAQIKSMNEINLLILKNNININVNEDPAVTDPGKKNKLNRNNYYNNLCSFFEDFGFVDTMHTYYTNLSKAHYLPIILAISTYNEIKKYYSVDKKTMEIKKSKGDDFDMFYYTYGVYTILYQMGRNNIVMFIALLSQLLRNNLIHQYSLKDFKAMYSSNPEIQKDGMIVQMFWQEIAANCGMDLSFFDINFNSYLMFRNLAN